MKKYCLLVTIFTLVLNNVFGEIKNGYEKEINGARTSLKSLNAFLISKDMSASQRKKVKAGIAVLVNYISYYELTENLLKQFKTISPGLYNRIDAIKDNKGRSTDVYVKFVPREEEEVMTAGITCIRQAEQDEHANISEYGERTVSVKIWVFNKALLVLSHELGHINYLVPNLASYFEYYRMNYHNLHTESVYVGHSFNDLSGKNAEVFEKKFKKDYASYLRNEADQLKTPLTLVLDIKKKIQSEMTAFNHLAAL